MTVINVAIIDDEALMRSGIKMILESADDIVVTVATSGVNAIEQIRTAGAHVVLLDPVTHQRGVEILIELRSWTKPPAVAMLARLNAEADPSTIMRFGASGFITKDTDPLLLSSLVRALAGGSVVLSPEVSKTLFRSCDLQGVDARQKIRSLTQRELEVLQQLAAGSSNKEVARTPFLSIGTVKDHVSMVLRKFEVATRIQAALIAERGGLGSWPGKPGETGPDLSDLQPRRSDRSVVLSLIHI